MTHLTEGEIVAVARRTAEKMRALAAKRGAPGTLNGGLHIEADGLLCEFLRAAGYDDMVDAYEAVDHSEKTK